VIFHAFVLCWRRGYLADREKYVILKKAAMRGPDSGCEYGWIATRHGPKERYMKNTNGFVDLGLVFDEIFQAAEDFREEFKERFAQDDCWGNGRSPFMDAFFNDNTDYYPAYSYPPANVIMASDRSLIFEFALAGFDEKGISLSFQGDYMVFSAKRDPDESHKSETAVGENLRYLKHRLKLKDIDKQKYFVPLDKYAQNEVKAVYKNGILRIRIPPKEDVEKDTGIKIEIVSE
jgi:HSP20 family molecular chaperone IbpA